MGVRSIIFFFHLAILALHQGATVSAADGFIPVIDIGLLREVNSIPSAGARQYCNTIAPVADSIGAASSTVGFFYISNHSVPQSLVQSLDTVSRQFFSLPAEEKHEISMRRGGSAWRGYFAVGDEVTSGIPDQKEGIYFGTELNLTEDLRPLPPLHGSNQWPTGAIGAELKLLVPQYMHEMRSLGTALMRALACYLLIPAVSATGEVHIEQMQNDIDEDFNLFSQQFAQPTELFRIFNYPPHDQQYGEQSLGVGEHSDYGYLTILRQDDAGGLQVRKTDTLWLDAPPIAGTFVINLGDALEYATHGLLKATHHRVQQRRGVVNDRISMPYFFDPCFDCIMQRVRLSKEFCSAADNNAVGEFERWDGMDVTMFNGTYGEYLMRKVSKVFPALFDEFIKIPIPSEQELIMR